jgi:FtsZ-binding cell division protein ZapB
MSAKVAPACACLLAVCVGGCAEFKLKPWSPPWAKKAQTDEPSARKSPAEQAAPEDPHQKRIRKLQLEIDTLKADKATLEAKVQHLQRREEDLAERTRKLQFANERLSEQIKGLALAPVDRDRYKALAEGLAIDVHRLRKENAALKRQLAQLTGPATRPATRPATAPSASATKPASRPTPAATRPAAAGEPARSD